MNNRAINLDLKIANKKLSIITKIIRNTEKRRKIISAIIVVEEDSKKNEGRGKNEKVKSVHDFCNASFLSY